jgi:hypothetical protein
MWIGKGWLRFLLGMRHIARMFIFLQTLNSLVMSKIKLNKIGNFQLTNNEKQELKGGKGDLLFPVVRCGCSCCYEGTPGGSTTQANKDANSALATGSLPCPAQS